MAVAAVRTASLGLTLVGPVDAVPNEVVVEVAAAGPLVALPQVLLLVALFAVLQPVAAAAAAVVAVAVAVLKTSHVPTWVMPGAVVPTLAGPEPAAAAVGAAPADDYDDIDDDDVLPLVRTLRLPSLSVFPQLSRWILHRLLLVRQLRWFLQLPGLFLLGIRLQLRWREPLRLFR